MTRKCGVEGKHTLYEGDCLAVMSEFGDSSVDTIVTDSPYGIAFMGNGWDHNVPGIPFWVEMLRVAKPGGMLLAFGGTRTFHRLACAIEDAGWEIRDTIMWVYGQGFPKSHNISKAIDKGAGVDRTAIGKISHPTSSDRTGNKSPYQAEKHLDGHFDMTEPATEPAKKWDGWGTALKPAWEPIIVAMKPLDGTFVNNALNHGVAGMWIDGARIETNPDVDDPRLGGKWKTDKAAKKVYNGGYTGKGIPSSPKGRWPANLIHDGSRDVADLFPNTQSGKCPNGFSGEFKAKVFGKYARNTINPDTVYGDSGSAARFFYVAKPTGGEKDGGLDEFFWKRDKDSPVGYTRIDREGWSDLPEHQRATGNIHNTVKPVELMRYLCRLTKTPDGGVVLDPFMGSGTTGVAAILEGREFIGIDLEREYVEISRKRIEMAVEKRKDPFQLTLL